MTERLATETIFANARVTIPMCDVAFIESDMRPEYKGAVTVVFKCSRWSNENQGFEPNVYLGQDEGPAFRSAYSKFRSEIDPVNSGP